MLWILSIIASSFFWLFTHFFWQWFALAGWVVLWLKVIQPLVRKYKAIDDFENKIITTIGKPFHQFMAHFGLYRTTGLAIGLSAYLQSVAAATKFAASSVLDVGPGVLQDVQSLDLKAIFSENFALQAASYIPMAIVILHWLAKLRDISVEPKKD
jgi:hypothetical protein